MHWSFDAIFVSEREKKKTKLAKISNVICVQLNMCVSVNMPDKKDDDDDDDDDNKSNFHEMKKIVFFFSVKQTHLDFR